MFRYGFSRGQRGKRERLGTRLIMTDTTDTTTPTTGTTGTTDTTGTTPTTGTTDTTATTTTTGTTDTTATTATTTSYYSNSSGQWLGTFWAVLHQVVPGSISTFADRSV